jgi:hypothetical protein
MLRSGTPPCQPFIHTSAGGTDILVCPCPRSSADLFAMELAKLLVLFDLRAGLFDAALDEYRFHLRLLPGEQVHFRLKSSIAW